MTQPVKRKRVFVLSRNSTALIIAVHTPCPNGASRPRKTVSKSNALIWFPLAIKKLKAYVFCFDDESLLVVWLSRYGTVLYLDISQITKGLFRS